MCRYAFYKYKNTYACFNCQIGFKRRNIFDVQPNLTSEDTVKDAKCPNCAGEMFNIGRDLRLPPKTKDEQWRCIKYLVDNKYNIYSCGCQGIGFVPHKMEDAITLVAEYEGRQKRYQKEQETAAKFEEKAKKKRDMAKQRKTEALLREIKKENKNIS
jgi:hypothetical protein